MVGDAKRGNKVIWSTGEASPTNCKAPYPFAMAEKRLKDRLTLKLINAYEYGIYSDVEADSFKKDSKMINDIKTEYEKLLELVREKQQIEEQWNAINNSTTKN